MLGSRSTPGASRPQRWTHVAAAVALATLLGGSRAAGAGPLEPRPHHVVVRHHAVADDPALGPRHAPVTVDFFLNLGNRHSLTLHDNVLQLAARHPRRLRVVYRFVVERDRSRMAEAAMEAFAQGRFLPFMDELVRNPDIRLPQRKQSLEEACRRAGVDFAALESAWQSGRHRPALERNAAYRYQRRVRLVPSLLFNGAPPRSPRVPRLRLGDLEAAYDAAHGAARRLMAEGVAVQHVYALSLRRVDREREHALPRYRSIDGPPAPGLRGPIRAAPLLGSNRLGPGHTSGPPGAHVSLLFYCNFASSRCAELAIYIEQLLRYFPRRLRLVFYPMYPRELEGEPLRDLLLLFRAALCADEQGEFWRFYREAYRRRQSQKLGLGPALRMPEDLDAVTRGMELDRARYDSCMARAGWDEEIVDRVRAGRKAGVEHSPTVVVGGRIYPGLKLLDELRSLVEQELMPGLLEQFSPKWPARSFDRYDRAEPARPNIVPVL